MSDERGHLYPPLEMDPPPAQSPMIGKSHMLHKLARRDYAIGICLLLLVVFLWTTSNFVTQVRL
jgi:solute carrier family 35, member F5